MKDFRPFQKKILMWYERNKRDLPWRRTANPYKILVSEMMLQQTQVDRALPYYARFTKRFPSMEALAKARQATVLKIWSGLGYNRRGLNLHRLAKQVMAQGGKLPTSYDGLVALPGIGPYTARAVLAFAFNKEEPVMDTNIRRVLIHELELPATIPLPKLSAIAQRAIPNGKSRLWHNALMDYGALVLTAKRTGIRPLSKQPRFSGSRRQARGRILWLLTKNKSLSRAELQNLLHRNDLAAILEQLEQEGFVRVTGKKVSLR
ncbi:MAG: Fe-S cluster assembly protein HesB [Nanoarchaeota archaeon]